MKKHIITIALILLGVVYGQPQMVSISAGSFEMGDDNTYLANPAHTVNLTNSFLIGKYEVTNQEYCDMLNYAITQNELSVTVAGDAIIIRNWDPAWGSNGVNGVQHILLKYADISHEPHEEILFHGTSSSGYFTVKEGRENRPIADVSWYGAVFYCNIISKLENYERFYDLTTAHWSSTDLYPEDVTYRLPTEAEWEFAARYNDGRVYPWGDDTPTQNHANYDFDLNNGGNSTDIGSFSPLGDSGLGVCDLVGNVNEWCNDWWADDFYSVSPTDNPVGPLSGYYHSIRGSHFDKNVNNLESVKREKSHPVGFNKKTGFRIVRIGASNSAIDNEQLTVNNEQLKQNYPNPFNPVTKINFQYPISNNQYSEIVVHNSVGQIVGVYPCPRPSSATNTHGSILFDGSNLNSGIYYYSLIIDNKIISTKSMVLIK